MYRFTILFYFNVNHYFPRLLPLVAGFHHGIQYQNCQHYGIIYGVHHRHSVVFPHSFPNWFKHEISFSHRVLQHDFQHHGQPYGHCPIDQHCY